MDAQTATDPLASLLPPHRKLIEDSAISLAVAAERGYRSVTKKAELKELGFSPAQCRVPALLIPIYGVSREIVTYQLRPDAPRIKKGKALKYETPYSTRIRLDVPLLAHEWLKDPKRPLFITEGGRKADAAVSKGLCCIAVLGVWNWRGTNEDGGKMALADWEFIALNDRKVYIVFDSDVMEKKSVHAALARLNAFLELRGAKVRIIYLPSGDGGLKVGLDDFFAAGNKADDLMKLATSELRGQERDADDSQYAATSIGLIWRKPTAEGSVNVPLTNFTARVISDVMEDDGAEKRRVFEIEASLNGIAVRATVAADEFATMKWPVKLLGAQAIIFPSRTEHAKCAIQSLSLGLKSRFVYAHTGWREIDDEWLYLHDGGAIGANGARDVEIDLPAYLVPFNLPLPASPDEVRACMKAVLALLDVAPDEITIPLFGSALCAVIGNADFSIFLVGPTGEGKSEITALNQAFFGAGFNARHFPGNWSNTANANEARAFVAKDAVFTVDDFCPKGSPQDAARMHKDADRLFRAQGNHSGRGRMSADGKLLPERYPRGLIVSSGEDIPRGESAQARLMIVELNPGDMKWPHLTTCQQAAREGVYARALAAFIQWLALRLNELRAKANDDLARLREDWVKRGLSGHKRTPTTAAHLARGWEIWLKAAIDYGAISRDEAKALWHRIWEAVAKAAKAQRDHHMAQNPALRFIELLQAAISSGKAHLASIDGNKPSEPQSCGWRKDDETQQEQGETWRAQGERIGWIEDDQIYLQPDAAYSTVQRLASSEGLTVTPQVLWKRLNQAGYLAATESNQQTLKVRKVVESRRQPVINLHRTILFPEN